MSYLIMRRGPTPGKLYKLTEDEVLIGRGTKNTIVIDDNEVSREHVRLVRADDGYELHDLDSSNGTFVNGQPAASETWLLQAQCIIELGDHITFEYHPGDPSEHDLSAEPIAEKLTKPSSQDGADFPQHYLVVSIHSQKEPAIYPLNGDVLTVGRGVNNDIVIVEPEMSREHFRLTLIGAKGYTLEDLGSTNGTMVNGELVDKPVSLETNDIIQIGTMVHIQYSANPDKFLAEARTETLPASPNMTDPASPVRQPRTTTEAMPDILIDRVSEPKRITPDLEEAKNLSEKVLITYAHEDWEKVIEPLVKSLKQKAIGIWVDQELEDDSDELRELSEQARLECPVLVVVVSPPAMDSEVVKRNWRHFHNREKPIILLIYQLVENLPIGSDKLTRIYFNPALPDVAFQRLEREIKRVMS